MVATPGQRPGSVCVGVRREAQLKEGLGWSAWGSECEQAKNFNLVLQHRAPVELSQQALHWGQ